MCRDSENEIHRRKSINQPILFPIALLLDSTHSIKKVMAIKDKMRASNGLSYNQICEIGSARLLNTAAINFKVLFLEKANYFKV